MNNDAPRLASGGTGYGVLQVRWSWPLGPLQPAYPQNSKEILLCLPPQELRRAFEESAWDIRLWQLQ